MERESITRTWGIAAVIILAIIGIVIVFLLVSSPARIQAVESGNPVITVQWKAQSVLESMFVARVVEHNGIILDVFKSRKDLANLNNTYLKSLRVWGGKGWIEGEAAFRRLGEILKEMNPDSISIDSVSIIIDHQPYADAESARTDIDAIATIRMTFSASPGDNIVEGTLLHRRVCTIEP